MKLEINDAIVDAILLDRLRDDYRMLVQDAIKLQSIQLNDGIALLNHQREDLLNSVKFARAMEVVLEYYDGSDWSERISYE